MRESISLRASVIFAALWALVFIPYHSIFQPLVGGETAFGAFLLLGGCLFGALQVPSGLSRLGLGVGLGGLALLVGASQSGFLPLVLGTAGAMGSVRILIAAGERLRCHERLTVEVLGVGVVTLFATLAEGMAGALGYVFVIWSFFLVEALLWASIRVLARGSGQERFDAAYRMAMRIIEGRQ